MIRKRKTKKGTKFDARIIVKGSPVFKTFDSKTEAERWVNMVRFRRDQGKKVTNESVTVQMMFDAYLEHADEKEFSVGALNSAKSRFKKHILPGYGSELDMVTVTKQEHQTFLRNLKKKKIGKTERKLTAATRNRVRDLVQSMYSIAIKYELFDGAFKVNPFFPIEKAPEPDCSIDYLSRDEMNKFLGGNRDSFYFPLLLLLFKTGVRIGEALGIHQEQIRDGILTIDRQFDSAANRIKFKTKSGKKRVIHLIGEVQEVLPNRKGPIFTKEDGTPLTPDYFRYFILPRACDRAGVRRFNPHVTRHTFASHYLMDGGSLWNLSKILGHADTKITEQRYGHFDLEHVRNRMRVVETNGNLIRIGNA